MMQICEEQSSHSSSPMLWFYLSVIGLFCWAGFEIRQAMFGHVSLLGFGYIVFFALILVWKYGFHYTYTLTNKEFSIVCTGFGIKKVKTIALKDMEYFAGKYARKSFAHVRTKSYWYSAGDANPTRTMIYFDQGKRKAVLFKVSEDFLSQLRKLRPQDYLEM